jgi:hypothetical protein
MRFAHVFLHYAFYLMREKKDKDNTAKPKG